MTTLSDIAPGDIWLAYVFFSDKPQTGKVRPILVVASKELLNGIIEHLNAG